MTRPNDAETAMIQSRELGLIKPLDNCEHRSIDESDIGICAAIAQLTNASIVVGL